MIDSKRFRALGLRLPNKRRSLTDLVSPSVVVAFLLAAGVGYWGAMGGPSVGQSDLSPNTVGRTASTPSPRPSARPIARPTPRRSAVRPKKPAARPTNRPTASRPAKKPVSQRPVAQRPVAQRPVAQRPVTPPAAARSSPRPVPAPQPVIQTAGPFESQANLTALATHLSQSGAKVYTTYWCGACRWQIKKFGSAKAKLPVIECDPDGQNPQTDLCKRKSVRGYPTWEINGQVYEAGGYGVNTLADLSGYSGPRN
jgi:hypothetical protein